jgi:hypothetical protein
MQQIEKKICQFAILEGDNTNPTQLLLIYTDGAKEFHKIINPTDKPLINTKLYVERIGANRY